MTEYRSANRRFRSAINRSKARCWQDLFDKVNGDSWGHSYKLLNRKFGVLLYGHYSLHTPYGIMTAMERRPLFSMKELEEAVRSMKNKNALGSARIPAEVYNLVHQGLADPELSSLRPLCMLDIAQKVIEKLIGSKLIETMCAAGDLSSRQFDFRAGRSTVDAVM